MNWEITGNMATITMDGRLFKAMNANDMSVWFCVPRHFYVAGTRLWENDVCVATPEEVLAANGYTENDGIDDDEEITITVSLVGFDTRKRGR